MPGINMYRIPLLITLFSALVISSCNSGSIALVIQNISGPDYIRAGETAEFTVVTNNVTSAELQWIVIPDDAGKLSDQVDYTVNFTASDTDEEIFATIRVVAISEYGNPVTSDRHITVIPIGSLAVGNIQGPTILTANVEAPYSISVEEVDGTTYAWSVWPGTAGTFSNPSAPSTTFIPSPVDDSTEAIILVNVSAPDYDPVLRQLNVTVEHAELRDGWVRTWGSATSKMSETGTVRAEDITFTIDDTVMVFGNIFQASDMDPGPGEYLVSPITEGYPDFFASEFSRDGEFLDCVAWGGAGHDYNTLVTNDNSGNFVFYGRTTQGMDFDPGPTQHIVEEGGDFLEVLDPDLNLLWMVQWKPSSFSMRDIRVGPMGNIYLLGAFSQTADFDPGPGEYFLGPQPYGYDAFLMSLDSAGNLRWVRTMRSSGDDSLDAMAIDPDGNIWMCGELKKSLTKFGTEGDPVEVEMQGIRDGFLVGYTSDGDFIDVITWPGDEKVWIPDLDIDNGGNIYLVGYFKGTADFDPGDGIDSRTTDADTDAFVLKLSSEREYIWCHSWGDGSQMSSNMIQVDFETGIVLSIFMDNAVDLDPGPGTYILDGSCGTYHYMKLTSDGEFVWANCWGLSDGSHILKDSEIDGFGTIWTSGYFNGTLGFDPGPAIYEVAASEYNYDAYLLKIPAGGFWN